MLRLRLTAWPPLSAPPASSRRTRLRAWSEPCRARPAGAPLRVEAGDDAPGAKGGGGIAPFCRKHAAPIPQGWPVCCRCSVSLPFFGPEKPHAVAWPPRGAARHSGTTDPSGHSAAFDSCFAARRNWRRGRVFILLNPPSECARPSACAKCCLCLPVCATTTHQSTCVSLSGTAHA